MSSGCRIETLVATCSPAAVHERDDGLGPIVAHTIYGLAHLDARLGGGLDEELGRQ